MNKICRHTAPLTCTKLNVESFAFTTQQTTTDVAAAQWRSGWVHETKDTTTDCVTGVLTVCVQSPMNVILTAVHQRQHLHHHHHTRLTHYHRFNSQELFPNSNCNWGTCITRPRAHHRVDPYPGAHQWCSQDFKVGGHTSDVARRADVGVGFLGRGSTAGPLLIN